MALDLPPCFGTCLEGQRLHLVAKLVCWDGEHESHLMTSVHDGSRFSLTGMLEGCGETFSLVNAEFRKQFPLPWIVLDDSSSVFRHDKPSWDALHEVIELCAGFGGMHQGFSALGYRSVAAVDSNERILKLYECQSDAHCIVGDVSDVSTMIQVWKHAKGAGTLVAGFACQPYSKLGDQRGGLDPRATCLTGILAMAFYLQVQTIVLECVQPAATNSFVVAQIQRFLDASGYFCSQCELRLDDVWPARRHRAWWLITAPFLGKIPLNSWPRMHMVSKVRHLIPALQPWDLGDEHALALLDVEKQAFGVENDSFFRYLLNFETCAPCALHSWGSQVIGCECGCRQSGLSCMRLQEKGLFGCLVRSCSTDSAPSTIRHAHPNEVMMLCGFDPIVDFGSNPRLTLAAAGQMASPLQVAWVFSALEERLLSIRGLPVAFNAEAQLQAFMTWLLMRGRHVWPAQDEPIQDHNTLALMKFWGRVSDLSMPELVSPLRWPELHSCTVSVAAVIDLLIRQYQASLPIPVQPVPDDVAMTAIDEDLQDLEPTPWYDPPLHVRVPVMTSPNGCVVVFQHEFANPVEMKVSEGETIQRLIHAHSQLVGNFCVTKVCDQEGHELSLSHALQVGQVVYISCEAEQVVSQPASSPVCPAAAFEPMPGAQVASEGCVLQEVPLPTISPTAQWSHPVVESGNQFHASSFGPFDAGQCETPSAKLPDCESWISAAPLLGLKGEQFLRLMVPVVQNTKHLWALRHQFLKAEDRGAILEAQEEVWSDDEIRHHIGLLLEMRNAKRFDGIIGQDRECMMLDPLLLTGWVQHGTQLCHVWARDHPEILQKGVIVLSACVVDGHWIPVVLTPNGKSLLFSTWDAPANSHGKLPEVIELLGQLLGFEQVTLMRHQRMFFMSTKCGALAVSFLHHSVFTSMLPTTNDEADMVHERLRAVYLQAVKSCQIARRPWIWGAGDNAWNDWTAFRMILALDPLMHRPTCPLCLPVASPINAFPKRSVWSCCVLKVRCGVTMRFVFNCST